MEKELQSKCIGKLFDDAVSTLLLLAEVYEIDRFGLFSAINDREPGPDIFQYRSASPEDEVKVLKAISSMARNGEYHMRRKPSARRITRYKKG